MSIFFFLWTVPFPQQILKHSLLDHKRNGFWTICFTDGGRRGESGGVTHHSCWKHTGCLSHLRNAEEVTWSPPTLCHYMSLMLAKLCNSIQLPAIRTKESIFFLSLKHKCNRWKKPTTIPHPLPYKHHDSFKLKEEMIQFFKSSSTQ
jgi:hypothetical protein